MKKKTEKKTQGQVLVHNAVAPVQPGFHGRFTCGTAPDEEPDCFQNAVRGLLKKGHSETKAMKAVEACFKALSKF
jgi:hypothetical protein